MLDAQYRNEEELCYKGNNTETVALLAKKRTGVIH